MKKIVRLTETDLVRLVKRVIKEENIKDKKNVLFIGDSFSSTPGITWNYRLAARHPEWDVTHIAGMGRKTDWMLENLKSELKNKKYDLVFIWGGINDIFSEQDINKPLNNLSAMAIITIGMNATPIIFSGYDIASVMTDDKLKPTPSCDKSCMLKSKDNMIKFQNILERNFKIPGGKVINRTYDSRIKANDGIHIGSDGHSAIAEYIDSKF